MPRVDLRLLLLLWALGLAAAQSGAAAPLGSVLHVEEQEYGKTLWNGTWTQRGDSDVYDAVWRRVPDGHEIRDTLRDVRIQGDQVRIHRDGTNGDYVGTLSADGKRIEMGTAAWYPSYSSWVAEIQDSESGPGAPGSSGDPGARLGSVVRVQERDYGKTLWDGTWTRRGNTDVYDAVWRRVPDGYEIRDTLRDVRIQGDRVVIHRDAANGDYVGYLSADGKQIERGTASWYQPYSSWVADLDADTSPVTPEPSGAANSLGVDLRATFQRIEPYGAGPSQPVVKDFAFPAAGRFRVTVSYSPWYRNSNEMFKWRSSVPIDGRDFGAWVDFIPGATWLSSPMASQDPVDATDRVLVNDYSVRSAQPGMQVAIFPATLRFGDGSMMQLPASASVVVEWLGDANR